MAERLRILEMLETGQIDAQEAAQRLEALSETVEPPESEEGSPAPITPPSFLKGIWQVVLWLGIALVAGGGLLVAAVYTWEVASGWLACGWPLFFIGVLVVLLGWWLPRARWIYVRVRQPKGPNIMIAFPLPLRIIAWGLRIARPFVPDFQDTAVDEVLMELASELRSDQPMVVEVNEGEDGERVQVYIG